MEGDYKIVDYDKYCQSCKHYDEDESDPKCPCFRCLDEPANIDSHKPLYFEEEWNGQTRSKNL